MERSQVNHNSNRSHKTKLEALYQDVRFPEAIDWWAAHYAENEMDVAISNARHLDPCRQAIENNVWRRIVPANGMVLDLACGEGHRVGQLSIIAVGHLACGAEPRQATLVGEGKHGDKG